MDLLKSKFTLKVFISYIALGLLCIFVGGIVYKEFRDYTQLQKNNASDQNKVFKIGHVLSLMYENESIARSVTQSNSQNSHNEYTANNHLIQVEIDSLKSLLSSPKQKQLLDTVKALLANKEQNIKQLKILKSADSSDASIDNALQKLKKMESSMNNYVLTDFIDNPNTLYPETKKVLEEYIANLNRTKSTTENVDRKTVNAIINSSTEILQTLKKNSIRQLSSVTTQEEELIKNDLIISQQIRQILTEIEKDALAHTKNVSLSRDLAMQKSQTVFAIAGFVGLILVILFTVIILSDFWKIQGFKKELEKSNSYTNSLLKSREHLIKMVSHDLRSPLSNILGYSELLKRDAAKNKFDLYLSKIENSSNYMIRLVEDLLDYSKLDADLIKPKEDDFNLYQVVHETAQNIQEYYRDKPIKLSIEIDTSLKNNIISDAHRIRQILNNLISNAFKYTEEGFIKISVRSKEEMSINNPHIEIMVKDSGIGIKKEKQDIIFNEFTQLEEDPSIQNGFGLGLTITKKLVSLLKGNIDFNSEPGIGTVFTVVLPVTYSTRITPQVVFKKNKVKTASNLHAIVIDDDDALRTLIEEVFISAKIKVTTFKDGEEALNNLMNIDFDFITTDIKLPKMSGFDFIIKLHTKSFYDQQPVIALTGRKDLDPDHYTDMGFSKVVFKPFTPHQILQAVESLFPVQNVKLQRIITESKHNIEKDNDNKTYNIKMLEQYIVDSNALKNILTIFVEDSYKNTQLLAQYVQEKNIAGINQISHKMLAMFKQIDAHQVVPILSQLETTKKFEETILRNIVFILNKRINEIVDDIKMHIA